MIRVTRGAPIVKLRIINLFQLGESGDRGLRATAGEMQMPPGGGLADWMKSCYIVF